jgi:hypothetical protein
MKEYRRFEILLPRRFKDGRRVPPALLRQTFREIEARFGAVSAERQTGCMAAGGKDVSRRTGPDVRGRSREREHDQFFQDFKETLKERFQQLEIWVTSHDIRVL